MTQMTAFDLYRPPSTFERIRIERIRRSRFPADTFSRAVVTGDFAESLNPRLLAPDRIPKIDGEVLKVQQIPATVVRTV